MAISLIDNLKIQNKKQNVDRDSFTTITDMRNYSPNYLPNIFHAMCEETGKMYVYNVNNDEDPDLGRWRVLEGSGGGTAEVPIEKIKVNGELQTPVNKVVDITVPSIEGLAKTSEIPTKVSQLENDSNYLSSIPEEYVTETELSSKGYLTEHQDLSEYAKTTDIPTKVSELENDSNYITSIAVPTATVTKTGTVSTFTVTDKNGTTSVDIKDGDLNNIHIVDTDYIAEPYEFNGKKSAWFGDSITKGFLTSTTNVKNTFVSIFCNLMKLSYTNYGLTSSLWTTGYRDLNTFLDTIKETDLSDCDYVFINGGINDYHSSVTMSDFTYAVDETLSYLENNFSGKIIVISPFNSVETSLSFSPTYNLQMYRNIIREKCVEYGCTYIAGISLISPSTTSFASTTYFVDNYHLNQSGHYLAGTRLAERFLNCNISSNIYTEEEQIIGYWINSKPIYRKVIHIGQFPSTVGTFYTEHNIDNLDIAIKVYGIGISSELISYPLPWSTNTDNAIISIFMDRTNIGIITAKDHSATFADSYAIVEYTKTTD